MRILGPIVVRGLDLRSLRWMRTAVFRRQGGQARVGNPRTNTEHPHEQHSRCPEAELSATEEHGSAECIWGGLEVRALVDLSWPLGANHGDTAEWHR